MKNVVTKAQVLTYLRKDKSNKEISEVLQAIVKEIDINDFLLISNCVKNKEDFSLYVELESNAGYLCVGMGELDSLIDKFRNSTNDNEVDVALRRISSVFTIMNSMTDELLCHKEVYEDTFNELLVEYTDNVKVINSLNEFDVAIRCDEECSERDMNFEAKFVDLDDLPF